MKKVKIYLTAVVFAAISMISGCAKDGEVGPQGPAGSNGTNGNANIRMFMYGPFTVSQASPTVMIPQPDEITKNLVDSSLILVYYQLNNKWWPATGLSTGASFAVRWEIEPRAGDASHYDVWIGLTNVDGSPYTGATYTLTNVKVIIAPASGFSGKKEPVDFNDYQATLKYFNLKNI